MSPSLEYAMTSVTIMDSAAPPADQIHIAVTLYDVTSTYTPTKMPLNGTTVEVVSFTPDNNFTNENIPFTHAQSTPANDYVLNTIITVPKDANGDPSLTAYVISRVIGPSGSTPFSNPVRVFSCPVKPTIVETFIKSEKEAVVVLSPPPEYVTNVSVICEFVNDMEVMFESFNLLDFNQTPDGTGNVYTVLTGYFPENTQIYGTSRWEIVYSAGNEETIIEPSGTQEYSPSGATAVSSSPVSNTVLFETQFIAPTLSIEDVSTPGSPALKLIWNVNFLDNTIFGVEKYELLRSELPDMSGSVLINEQQATDSTIYTYTDNSISYNTVYYYQVVAVSETSNYYSNIVSGEVFEAMDLTNQTVLPSNYMPVLSSISKTSTAVTTNPNFTFVGLNPPANDDLYNKLPSDKSLVWYLTLNNTATSEQWVITKPYMPNYNIFQIVIESGMVDIYGNIVTIDLNVTYQLLVSLKVVNSDGSIVSSSNEVSAYSVVPALSTVSDIMQTTSEFSFTLTTSSPYGTAGIFQVLSINELGSSELPAFYDFSSQIDILNTPGESDGSKIFNVNVPLTPTLKLNTTYTYSINVSNTSGLLRELGEFTILS
jgi:hypothetical protein